MIRPTCRTGSPSLASGELVPHHVADPQQHVRQQRRLRRARLLEHPPRLRVDVAEAHGDVLVARVEPPAQLGIADRGGDRVRVRVAVAGDVDAGHAHIIPLQA